MDDKKLKEICKIGQGEECCRYLVLGPQGFECGKFQGYKNLIDERVKTGSFNAKGDNASQRMVREKNDRISMTIRECRGVVEDTINYFNNAEFKKKEGL